MRFKCQYFVLSLVFVFCSCSSTKLMDSWKAQGFEGIASTKILVISQTSEAEVRKSYEKAIVSKLRSKNINAVESFVEFPLLQEAKTLEEQQVIVKKFVSRQHKLD